jgi:hypothetical protein
MYFGLTVAVLWQYACAINLTIDTQWLLLTAVE